MKFTDDELAQRMEDSLKEQDKRRIAVITEEAFGLDLKQVRVVVDGKLMHTMLVHARMGYVLPDWYELSDRVPDLVIYWRSDVAECEVACP